ncbi:ATP-binding protein [Kitasatospora sp. NPDC087271]|uniref:ATP-binding protein n=1 Tax=Kitasatospora sp. NPDC087271 TaxID=3364067 RepID=UPI00382A99B3
MVLHVAPTPEGAAATRRALLVGIGRWGLPLPPDRIEDVKLLAGEVIANAVIHTGKAATVAAIWTGTAVRVEVADESDQMPLVQEHFGEEVTSGQGLTLVKALSNAWGAKVDKRTGTKVVWFECGPRHGLSVSQPEATVVAMPDRPHNEPRLQAPRAHEAPPRPRSGWIHRRGVAAVIAAGHVTVVGLLSQAAIHDVPSQFAATGPVFAPDLPPATSTLPHVTDGS